MATYLIGDIQGCYVELQELLQRIDFNPRVDRLGCVGDLVNRGPDSLNVLRFLKNLDDPLLVLGNHDLYLLILGYELVPMDAYPHTLQALLQAPDRFELLDWLRQQPLFSIEPKNNVAVVHAGIPPQWSIQQCQAHALEVQQALQAANFKDFLKNLFGDQPDTWQPTLTGIDRLRYITNALTRMRFCNQEGVLDFSAQDPQVAPAPNFKPWFMWQKDKTEMDIFFGHWAKLGGVCDHPHCHALDTGCAWGESLTAIRLEDRKRFSVSANKISSP